MKRIKIIRTEDEYECDTCGWDWQESYQVEYDGKLYGNEAHATCFGAENTSLADALLLFIQDQGFDVEHEDVVYET
jgi:transposase-like protein